MLMFEYLHLHIHLQNLKKVHKHAKSITRKVLMENKDEMKDDVLYLLKMRTQHFRTYYHDREATRADRMDDDVLIRRENQRFYQNKYASLKAQKSL